MKTVKMPMINKPRTTVFRFVKIALLFSIFAYAVFLMYPSHSDIPPQRSAKASHTLF